MSKKTPAKKVRQDNRDRAPKMKGGFIREKSKLVRSNGQTSAAMRVAAR